MHARKHRSQNLACTDCSSALEQATDKFYSIFELGQIEDKDATIKFKYVYAHKHKSQNLACTDFRSALEQATDKFDTVLDSWQIRDENPSIKISKCACTQAQKPKP